MRMGPNPTQFLQRAAWCGQQGMVYVQQDFCLDAKVRIHQQLVGLCDCAGMHIFYGQQAVDHFMIAVDGAKNILKRSAGKILYVLTKMLTYCQVGVCARNSLKCDHRFHICALHGAKS